MSVRLTCMNATQHERERFKFEVRYQRADSTCTRVVVRTYARAETVDGAKKALRAVKRRGYHGWIERPCGEFVPVKGASRFPTHALSYLRGDGVPVTRRSDKWT